MIQVGWVKGSVGVSAMGTTMAKIDGCKQALVGWSHAEFGSVHRTIGNLTRQLEWLQCAENPDNLEEIERVHNEIDHLLEIEDVRWKQRAKRNWFLRWDRNTQYFHAWASHRRRQNNIDQIMDLEGNVWKAQKDIGQVFSSYFQHIYTSEGTVGMGDCLSVAPTKVTTAMNADLLRVFSPKEVDKLWHRCIP